MGSPDGGPYDETPPKVIHTSPKFGAVNEKNVKKVTIEFDEIVKIDNPSERVVISPPQIQQPEIEADGRRITIALFDTLKPGMTYTIDMNVESTVKLDENGMFVSVEGDRRVKDVTVGGEPIDPEKTYTLASHNYKLKDCGDGYTMFADNLFLQDSVMIDNQVLINYIVNVLGGTVGEEYSDPYGQGRITIVE